MRDSLCIWTHAKIFVGGGGEGQAPKRPHKVIKGPPPHRGKNLKEKGVAKKLPHGENDPHGKINEKAPYIKN